MTINIKGLGKVKIKHYEIEDNWEEMSLKMTKENIDALKEVEPILKENGLTINDLIVSLLKLIVEEKDKVKEFVKANLKQPKILGATLLSKEEAKTLLKKDKLTYGENWWLRTPGDASYYACFVNYYGYVDTIGRYVYYNIYKVRPALNIDISTSNIKVGDVFEFGGKEFKVLSPELAWMHRDDIGCYAFRENWTAEDANIYEASDVKKFVDAWFEKARTELTK